VSKREPLTRARLRLEARRSVTPLLMWCALVGIGLYAGFFLFSQLGIPLPWQHQYGFRVAIDDAKGVVPGSDQVRIAGVVVGKITAVNLEGSDPVRPVLTVEIGKQYAPIYKNARAELRPNTPLDDMYLDIVSRGTRSAGAVGEGGELAADRTQTPVEIGQILDVFNASVRPRVEAAIDQSGIGLGDHGAQFRQALVELAPFLRSARRLSSEIATRQSETKMLVLNLNLMSAELAKRSDQLNGLVVDAGSTFSAVGNAAGPLAQTISELPSTLEQLVPAFTEVRSAASQLDPALQALLPTARALPSGLRAAMQLADASEPSATATRGADPRGHAAGGQPGDLVCSADAADSRAAARAGRDRSVRDRGRRLPAGVELGVQVLRREWRVRARGERHQRRQCDRREGSKPDA